MYLLLSAMTALLECGPIFLLNNMELKLWQVLASCLSYQAGNLLPLRIHFCKRQLTGMTCLSIGLFITAFNCNYSFIQWLLLLPGFVCLSTALQIVRAAVKVKSSTARKRMARVIGFLLTPLMGHFPLLLLLSSSFIILFELHHTEDVEIAKNAPVSLHNKLWTNPSCQIMLWHQLHYFIYAYATILQVLTNTDHPFLTMLLFAGTWITYLITEPLICRFYMCSVKSPATRILNSTTIILTGHLFLLFTLLLLPSTNSLFTFSILWILAGFGGGTVFAITALCKHSPGYEKVHLDMTEGIGHFTGTLVEVIWLLIFPNAAVYLPYLSALCVTVVLLKTMKIRRKNHENSNYTC